MSGGWNPVTGRDSTGNRPTFAPAGAPMPNANQAYIPHYGGPGMGYIYGNNPYATNWNSFAYTYPSYTGTATNCGLPAQSCTYWAVQPNGAGNYYVRQPAVHPNIDTAMPAAQMTNSSGGVGCEPGYNYFFSAEHTKVHVFKSDTPPWQLPASARLPFKAAHVPSDTTVASLLKGFGCDNPSAKKNRVYELVSCGNGKWYKGMCIDGANKDLVKKTVKEVGWDKSRSGLPGEKPVVCLWFCKD